MIAGDIRTRLQSHGTIKAALTLWLATGFTALYLLLQWHTLFPVTPVPPTWIDRAIPFTPGAVYLYESLWLLLPASFWLMKSRETLLHFVRAFFLISLVSFAIFLLFPTSSPRPEALHDVNIVYGSLIRIDKELNAFPSLHVALAILCGTSFHGLVARARWGGAIRGFTWAWVFGIMAATLLTKQHGVIDALGGALAGAAGCALGGLGLRPDSIAPATKPFLPRKSPR